MKSGSSEHQVTVQPTIKSLADIKAEVDRLAAIIGASDYHALPTYGRTEDFARPHIEVDSHSYHFVVVERGQELERFTTFELDDVFYKIFQNVTFSLAIDYELAHRIETKDSRRITFQKRVDLLAQLSQSWADRQSAELDQILQKHPFDDQSGIRARLSAKVGWKKACEQYPLPLKSDEKGGAA